jgi:hypothetical protein
VNPINLALEMSKSLTQVSHVLAALDSASSTSQEIGRRRESRSTGRCGESRRNFVPFSLESQRDMEEAAALVGWHVSDDMSANHRTPSCEGFPSERVDSVPVAFGRYF